MNEIHHPPSVSSNPESEVAPEQERQTEALSPATEIYSDVNTNTNINTNTNTQPQINHTPINQTNINPNINATAQPGANALPAFKDMTAAQKRQLIKVMSGMIAGVMWKSLKPFIIAGILSGAIYYSYERSASAHRDTVAHAQQNKASQAIDVPK